MKSERYAFAIEDISVIKEDPDSKFAVVEIDFFASGENLNNMYVSQETLLKTADTIKNCPIIWSYDKVLDDAYSHSPDETPAGFIPETSEIKTRKLEDGRTMLSATGYIWRRYTGTLLEIFKRDGGKKPVSVEMLVYQMKRMANGLKELLDFRFEGITVLGSYVTPAIPNAEANILSFSEDLEKEYIEDYRKEFSERGIKIDSTFAEELKKKKNIITFPYKSLEDINSALKGISPPISLSQANEIASQADSIGEDENKSGWAIAISNFKKTHEVKDGRWVKKGNKEMTMDKEMQLEEKQEFEERENKEEEIPASQEDSNDSTNMAKEKSEEEKPSEKEKSLEKEKPSEEEMPEEKEKSSEKEKPSPGEEKQEEKPEEKEKDKKPKEEEMSKEDTNWGEFDFDGVCKLFEEGDEFENVRIEFEKKEKANPIIIIKGLLLKLSHYEAEVEELSKKLEEYKQYKEDIEKSQKAFAVEQTIQELSQKVVIPEEEKERMIAEAEKYSFENLETWKNYCKALSFEFAIKEKDENKVIKVGLPFGNTKKTKNDLWS